MNGKAAILAMGLALVLGAGEATAQAWRGTAALEAEVTDRGRKPLAGAEVVLEFVQIEPPAGPPPVVTDATGTAAVYGLAEGRWRFEVRYQGTRPYSAVIEVEADRRAVVIAGPVRDAAAPPLNVKFVKARSRPAPPPPPQPVQPRPAQPRPQPRESAPPRAAPPAREAPASPPAADSGTEAGEGAREGAASPPAAPPQPSPTPPSAEPTAGGAPAPPPAGQERPSEPEPAVPPGTRPAAPPAGEPRQETEPAEAPQPEPATAPETPRPGPAAALPEETPRAEPVTPPRPEPPASARAPEGVPRPQPAPPAESVPVPEPAAPPPLPEPEAEAPPPAAAVRSATAGTCPECPPGEAAVSAELSAAPGRGGSCQAETAGRAAALALARGAESGLRGYAGPLLDPATGRAVALAGPETRAEIERLLAPYARPDAPCQLLAVVLPAGARYTGYGYEASDADLSGPCGGDEVCAIGQARFTSHPVIEKTPEGTLLFAVFENSSPDRERRARLTVYFRPAR